ncbi:MAG: c-type cytochrome [Burkholderiales bacterium]
MKAERGIASNVRDIMQMSPIVALAIALCALGPGIARGAEDTTPKAVEREVIPGAEKLTAEQRETYRRRMAAAATAQEKAKIRAEYATAAEKPVPVLVGDPARGAKVHTACFSCHGVERYVAPVTYLAATFIDSVLRASGLSDLPPAEPKSFKGRAKSIDELRAGVVRRNDLLNPKLTPQEIEDVVAYLNATYYKFPQ